ERCTPWLSVEHLIVHNIKTNSSQLHSSLISEGKQILSQIPGVREVFTGETIKTDDQTKFCWLVRFTHKAALENFHQHQEFDAFFKKKLNASNGDIICIDFQEKA
ncbi:MAG: hypothetical protein HN826_03255, partial [Methylococcales bacterium]|nr:hypothetical protein [Methylococcales bacterium]